MWKMILKHEQLEKEYDKNPSAHNKSKVHSLKMVIWQMSAIDDDVMDVDIWN